MIRRLLQATVSSRVPVVRTYAHLTNPSNMSTQTVGTPHATKGPAPTPAAAIEFFMLLEKLKTTKRTGWVKRGVQLPESIADHMYRMGVMAMLVTDSHMDVTRCIKMAIVHDVAEAIVGDITPHCQVSPEEKQRLESDAIKTIQDMLGTTTHAAQEVSELWWEYEGGSTPEAQLVKDLDKLEMIIQAHEYEQSQGKELQEFFDSTAGKWRTDTGRAWAAELVARRQATRTKAEQQAAGTIEQSASK